MSNIRISRSLRNSPYYALKFRVLLGIMSFIFLIVIMRLFVLQIVKGEDYRQRSLNSRKQIITIPSFRGGIFIDDGAKVIVENTPAFSLYLVPENFVKAYRGFGLDFAIQKIALEFDIREKVIRNVLRKGRSNPYRAYLIKQEVSKEKIHYLAENLEKYPGLIYGGDYHRHYVEGSKYGHITGYIRPIGIREYRKRKNLGYNISSFIGKQGVEGFYDIELRGREGYKVQLVDIRNRVKEEYQLQEGEAIPGKDIILTIDSRMQNIVHRVMQGYPGAAVVSKVSNGEILALYSFPDYDPNIFIGNFGKEDREIFDQLKNDPNRPFLNRVIQGNYPPSSVFKLVLALAAMEIPVVDLKKFNAECKGGIKIGPTLFGCLGVHGRQNYVEAIAHSCNVFFYHLGLKLGPKVIHRFAQNYFNFGKKTGIDLLYERPGLMPTQKWKIENQGGFWWDGDTANSSIGQGFVQTTVLQINVLTAAIAGDGRAYVPHLMRKIVSKEGKGATYKKKPKILVELPFPAKNIKDVQRAMRAVVNWGTARRSNTDKFLVAGKTGTAQTSREHQYHSWFTAYAPYDAPIEDRIAITVFLEYGGHGGVIAAPFAMSILEGFFLGVDPLISIKKRLQPWKTQRVKYLNWLKIRNEKPLPESFFAVEKKRKAALEEKGKKVEEEKEEEEEKDEEKTLIEMKK